MSGAAVDPETDRIFIGSHDKGFRCISWDGKLVWSFGARDMIMSSPVVTQNLVIFGSLDGTVYGLHKGDGHLVWKHIEDQTGPVSGSVGVSDRFVAFASKAYDYTPQQECQGTPGSLH